MSHLLYYNITIANSVLVNIVPGIFKLVFESLVTGLQKDHNWTELRLQKAGPAVWSFDF